MARISFNPGDIPSKPGVYIYRDRFGEVIYIGKASNLRKRMSQYFQPSRMRLADPKSRSLINSIASWEFRTVKNESESLILESRLIKEYTPRYNVLMRDDKRYLMLKIDMTERFPRIKLSRIRREDGSIYIGPFPVSRVIRECAIFLSRFYGLRICKCNEPGERDRSHCLAAVIKDCCRPCEGNISDDEYMERVKKLVKLFESGDKELMASLELKMKEAAAALDFEKASKWRDILSGIRELSSNRNFRYASIRSEGGLEAVKLLQDFLKMQNPPSRIEAFDISNISGELAVASMVSFKDGRPDKKSYRRFRIREVSGIDDFAMMSEAVKRHFRRKMEEHTAFPDLLLIDGGKGQLSSALQSLSEIGCELSFTVAGLAKKNEEIYLPGAHDPLIIPKDSPALKLLQAVRDEAHRFAVTYHRQLRNKRIQESIIDEIEGIGPERRKAILTEFGSVRALRQANAEEICRRVPGIGPNIASAILEKLSPQKRDE